MEIMELLQNYIVIPVMVFCAGIGYIMKNLIPSTEINKYIPLTMSLCGIVFNIWFSGWIISPEVILGGMASGLASTGAYELIKQLSVKSN